jgi:hypothetical protein
MIAAVLVVPFLLPYRAARTEQGLARSLDEVARYSAAPGDYLATGGQLHFALWSRRFYRATDALFPGFIALGLTLWAIARGRAFRDPRARMALAFGLAGFVLSFGPRVPLYGLLYAWIPLLQGIRGAARFGHLALMSVAILAGFGLAELRRALFSSPRVSKAAAAAVPIVLVVLANIESLRAPLGYTPFPGIPGVYASLASEDDAVVAELPFFRLPRVSRNAEYMLGSTRHWKPIINGYSGFIPESYRERMEPLMGFPDDRSLETLRAAKVTHVIVHTDALPGADALERNPAFSLMALGRNIRIYRFH